MSAKTTLYDRDFFAWSLEQVKLLRAGKLAEADIEHIAEEIETMGRTEKRELISRLSVLLLHLLKWRYQPERRSPSWEASIRVQRNRLADHLDDNPSLKPSCRRRSCQPIAMRRWRRSQRRDCPERPSRRLLRGQLSRCWTASSGRGEHGGSMGQSSDSAETQIFMAAFQELRNRVADNTSFLVDEALRTEALARLCFDVFEAGCLLENAERRHRELY